MTSDTLTATRTMAPEFSASPTEGEAERTMPADVVDGIGVL
jgi:hypothetical protein